MYIDISCTVPEALNEFFKCVQIGARSWRRAEVTRGDRSFRQDAVYVYAAGNEAKKKGNNRAILISVTTVDMSLGYVLNIGNDQLVLKRCAILTEVKDCLALTLRYY